MAETTGLENELLEGDVEAVEEEVVEEEAGWQYDQQAIDDILAKIEAGQAGQLTPAERLAYKMWLGWTEEGDPYARIDDPYNQDDQNLSDAYELLGTGYPEPPTFDELIDKYEAEHGEGSFQSLSRGQQNEWMQANHAAEAWNHEAYHEYYNTVGSYDPDSFEGYDEDGTYMFAYGLEGDGNSGYQNLRPWDVEAQEMSVGDLREIYANDPNLQGTFASEDDFLNYVAEMNHAGFGDIYGGSENTTVTRNEFDNNPLAQDIFGRYANAPEGLTINGYTATNEFGDTFEWTGSQWMPVEMAYRPSVAGGMIKMVVGTGLGLAFGNAAGALGGLGGLGGTASGALSGAVSSALGQLVVNGEIDPSALMQAMILGGIGGFADQLRNMDGAIANGGILGTADDIVTATSDLLNIPYDEALSLLQGVAEGAVSGADLESIVGNAVGSWGTHQVMDFLQGVYGDTVNVEDWFKEGESHIPIEALEPIVDQILGGVIDGSIDDPQAWLRTVWDYFEAGGDVDFMLPDGVSLGDIFNGAGFDLVGCDEGKGEDWWFCNIDVPGFGVDVDLPDVLECMEGFTWSDLYNTCIPIGDIDLPDVVECMEGWEWDDLLEQCVEIPDLPDVLECMEGWEWDDLLEQCVQIDAELPDVVECMEGWEWDDLLEQCVEIPDLPDVVECMEGWEWDDLLGKCVEVNVDLGSTDCEEGFHWDSLLGQCVEIDIDLPDDPDKPDVDLPDVDVPDVDLPDLPEGEGSKGDAVAKWSDLFQYTTITTPQQSKYAPQLNALSKVRSMFNDIS